MFGLVITTDAHLAFSGARTHSNNTTEMTSPVIFSGHVTARFTKLSEKSSINLIFAPCRTPKRLVAGQLDPNITESAQELQGPSAQPLLSSTMVKS